jgi:hypothetical protein
MAVLNGSSSTLTSGASSRTLLISSSPSTTIE